MKLLPTYEKTSQRLPNWIDTVVSGEKIYPHDIGLLRGLFWQPAHIELVGEENTEACSCCGVTTGYLYIGFKKEKFNYTLEGVWPHPHSPRTLTLKKGIQEEKYASFTTTAPAWTQLNRFLIERHDSDKKGQSQIPAAVIEQARELLRDKPLHLIVGGYRNNQASILQRRHELFSIAKGWEQHLEDIEELINTGREYKTVLRRALFLFATGIKEQDIKGAGINLYDSAEKLFYRQTEALIHQHLQEIDFDSYRKTFSQLHRQFSAKVRSLFEEVTRPYRQDPKLIKILAIARRSMGKQLRELNADIIEGAEQ
jgi:CRISPR system Cascade subunit CasA